jgi:hypothetical protein
LSLLSLLVRSCVPFTLPISPPSVARRANEDLFPGGPVHPAQRAPSLTNTDPAQATTYDELRKRPNMAHTGDPPQAFPLGFDEIEELVKSLYNPGNAKKISQNEATLRILQRSPQGWEIADALLKSNNEQVRFFGALTLTVKLNADSCVFYQGHVSNADRPLGPNSRKNTLNNCCRP